jgi:hypothetical protein
MWLEKVGSLAWLDCTIYYYYPYFTFDVWDVLRDPLLETFRFLLATPSPAAP